MKNLRALVLVSFLLFSSAAGMLFVESSSANFFPEQAPYGIRIDSDGSVTGTDKISRNLNVYTFTGDIDGGIAILADGVLLDGAGYTLRGLGSDSGVFLQERDDVTIKNLKIMNFEYGIKFTWLNYGYSGAPKKNNTVSDNIIANNTYGILIHDGKVANVFSNNRITENVYGVRFSSFAQPSDNVFRNNVFNDNKYSIADDCDNANDVDTSNTVNGKPVYYWVNKNDLTVPTDAGYVVLKNCSGITVQSLKISNNGQGVLLCYTTYSKIIGNVLTNSVEGIELRGSSNNTISGNRVANNVDGIRLDQTSKNNVVSENVMGSNERDGVCIGGSSGILVSHNQIVNNGENGISTAGLKDSSFVGNNITLNKGYGLTFTYEADGNKVSGNLFEKNGLGILIEHSIENTVTENTMTGNTGFAMRLNGSQANNVIHHNNFIDNNVGQGLQVSMPAIWSFYTTNYSVNLRDLANRSTTKKDFPPPDPTLNPANPDSWDDGRAGNYWSDYLSRYPNASEVGDTGVGNTPFFINENNIDHYPLMSPVGISNADLPANSSSPSPSEEPAPPQSTDQQAKPQPFPTALLVVASGASATAAVAGLFVYFKKRNHEKAG
jgi:parallel beta-helix repeat protein